jgi:hypothetical protein
MHTSCALWLLMAGAASEVNPEAAFPVPAAAPAHPSAAIPSARTRTAARQRPVRTTRAAGGASGAASLIDLIQNTVAPDQWQPPAAIGTFGGGGGGTALGSNTAGLILLIQTTIVPESWDVNGGLGSISPFGP